MAYSNDSKPSVVGDPNLVTGSPTGLLLVLTKNSGTPEYVFDSEPAAVAYSFDSKPS